MVEFSLINSDKLPLPLSPDITFLQKFSDGDLGIGDKIRKNLVLRNISSIKSPEVLEIFAKSSGLSLGSDPSSYFKDNKLKLTESDIKFDQLSDLGGIKALEKSLLQSIFETQKPYMEIIKLVLGNLVKIEDTIARTLALAQSSLNPAYNPKALGYKGRKPTISETLSQLQSISNPSISNNSGSTTKTTNNLDDINKSGKRYEIISTQYSTGEYKPSVKYNYEYIDIIEIKKSLSSIGFNPNDSDPYDKIKPQTIVLAIYDTNGNQLENDKIPQWLLNSGKWFGQFDQLSNISYMWNNGTDSKQQYLSPDGSWRRQLNLSGDNINKPVILPSSYNTQPYISFYNEYLKKKINENDKLTQSQKDECLKESLSKIDIPSQIENNIKYGFLCDLSLTNGNNPLNKFSFSPKKINIKNQECWIDPESDYDMKIFKILPSSSVSPSSLSTQAKYSNGYYGSSDDEIKQTIEDLFRYAQQPNDTEVYYIVEGIISDGSNSSNNNTNNSSGGKRVYKKKDFLGVMKNFAGVIADIFSKLIPAITSLLNLLKNPASFIVDIIIKKLGDNNGSESPKFLFFTDKFKEEFDNLKGTLDKQQFIDNSLLKNMIFVKDDDTFKFILDGSSEIELFGIKFGVEVKDLVPKLIFDINSSNIQKLFDFINSKQNSLSSTVNKGNPLFNATLSPENKVINEPINNRPLDEVTIQYSTGEYIEGVKYEYRYVTEYINSLIIKAESLELSSSPDDLLKALNIYIDIKKIDPSNSFIDDKIKKLKELLSKISGNPIISLILNFVSFPFKVIKSIIEYIMDFFKSLTNPFELASKLSEFLSFKWIMNFFKPTQLLELCGVKFDIATFKSWIKNIDSLPDDQIFDLSSIMSMPFMPPMFSANKEQLKTLTKTPLAMLSSIICLVESIINSFIDFIWGLLGLVPIIPPPHIKLCKDTNQDLSPMDIMEILNGNYIDAISSGEVKNKLDDSIANYDFIYNILLPDGRNIRELNIVELEEWIEENKDISYEFNF